MLSFLHELTAGVLTYTRPTQDQSNLNLSIDMGENFMTPPHTGELLAMDSCWGGRIILF